MGHVVIQADDEASIKRGLEIYITRWKQDQLQCSVLKSPYTVTEGVDELIFFGKKYCIFRILVDRYCQ